MIRQWLAALISDRDVSSFAELEFSAESVVAEAAAQGVSALAYERVARNEMVCSREIRDGLADIARQDAVRNLLLESETRQVIGLLHDAGLPTMLLKGSALACWLYPSPHLRARADIDLLMETQDAAERAVTVLARLSYQRRERVLPGDLTTCEITCVRDVAAAPVEVDLHWGIGGAPVYFSCVSPGELFGSAQHLSRLSPYAYGPEPVHAFLHAAMHRVLNMHLEDDRLKWIHDFHLLAQHFSEAHWCRLLELAGGRGLAGTCLSALEASQTTFSTFVPVQVKLALTDLSRKEQLAVSRMDWWPYIQWSNLRALPDVSTRCRWMLQRLRPSPRYMQDTYGKSTFGSWSLYLRHGFHKFFH